MKLFDSYFAYKKLLDKVCPCNLVYADYNYHFLTHLPKKFSENRTFQQFLAENRFLPILCVYFEYV